MRLKLKHQRRLQQAATLALNRTTAPSGYLEAPSVTKASLVEVVTELTGNASDSKHMSAGISGLELLEPKNRNRTFSGHRGVGQMKVNILRKLDDIKPIIYCAAILGS